MVKALATADVSRERLAVIERIHHQWNEGLDRKDADAVAALYAENAVLESPLVRHILKNEEGILTGRKTIHAFLKRIFERTPTSRHIYRPSFFTDGRTVLWEYPRQTPEGEQMDFVEVMQIDDDLIQNHHVYWGWYGVKIMEQDRYWR